MTQGINLLPLEERSKELEEEKERQKAREKYNPKLSSPTFVGDNRLASSSLPRKNLLARFNDWWRGRKELKQFRQAQENKMNKTVTADKPSVPAPTRVFVAAKPAAPVTWPEKKTEIPVSQSSPLAAPVILPPLTMSNNPIKLPDLPLRPSNRFTSGDKVPAGIDVNLASPEKWSFNLSQKSKIVICFFCLLLLVVGIAGKSFLLRKQIKTYQIILTNTEDKILALQEKISLTVKDNKDPLLLQAHLLKLDKKLDAHIWAHKVFDYLEANTASGVYYESVNVDTSVGSLVLNGVALDYAAAAQQVLIFNHDKKNILKVDLSDMTKQKENLEDNTDKKNHVEPRELIYFSLDMLLNYDFFNLNTTTPATTTQTII
ncbi:MAG TPA: hypothetical protein PLH37_02845 [bacterium]|nr:hypothetical protein [bacterium]